MTTNSILAEIRQTRDDLAQEAGYDLQRLFDNARKREREAAAKGVKFVSPISSDVILSSSVVREDPPKP